MPSQPTLPLLGIALLLSLPVLAQQPPLPEGAESRVGSVGDPAKLPGIYRVELSPDGQTLATRGADQIVRVWDLTTGKERFPLDGHEDRVYDLAFSRDGKRIVTVSPGADEKILLWDTRTGKLVKEMEQAGRVVRFSPAGDQLWVAGQEAVTFYDADSGHELRKTEIPRTQIPLAISRDGKLLAEFRSAHPTTINYPILLRDLTNGVRRRALPGLQAYPVMAAFSPDGNYLAACGRREAKVHLWGVGEDQEHHLLINHREPVQAIAFSPDGRQLATASWDHTLCVWEVITAKPIMVLQGHTEHVCAVGFSPRGDKLVSGASGRTDNSALVWNLPGLLYPPGIAPDAWNASTADHVWDQLAAEDPKTAYPAIGTLLAAPERALALVQAKLGLEEVEEQDVSGLIAQLNHEDFFVREQAHKQLVALKDIARNELEAALADPSSAEVRYRIRQILQSSLANRNLTAVEWRRMNRVIQTLELLASPPSLELLRAIAAGHPDSQVIHQAGLAVSRVKRWQGAAER